MIEYVIALSLIQSPSWGTHTPMDYSVLTDAEHCEQLGGLFRDVSRNLPERLDTTTLSVGNSLDCEGRVVTMERLVTAELSNMTEGWQTLRRSQWDDEVCASRILGVLARRGWRIRQNLSLQNGERISMDAHCPCPT